MLKVGCGRRQESDVWSYFKYDAVKGSSKCLIADDTGAVCPALMQGKFGIGYISDSRLKIYKV
jgi:hypothetical protein